MGWENVFHCEWNKFGQKVLKHHFPKAISYNDITQTDFTIYRGRIDLLSGGFPCQDASIAKQHGGGQRGLRGNRTGLWREMFRAIGEIAPKYVIAENVANILRTNAGDDWRVILEGLSGLGYNAVWRTCRASEVGAPHHRARVFLVAYPMRLRIQATESFFSFLSEEIPQRRRKCIRAASSVGLSWEREPEVLQVDDGFPRELDGITFPKWRNESIKAYGNAIVPQVAYQIFKAIADYENL